MEADLVYHVDKDLGIIPIEMFNRLGLIVVREYCCDHRDALVHGEGMTDQLLPGRGITARERAVKSTNVRSPE